MVKKWVVICLTVAMIVVLAACNSSNSANESTPGESEIALGAPKESAELKIVYYGDESGRMSEFVKNEIKALVKKELNAELELEYLPWSEYGAGKTDLMLASGEDFASYTDIDQLGKKVAKGYYADLTPYVEQGVPDLKNNVESLSFEAFQLSGKQYAIPVGNKPNAGEFYSVLVRQDLMDEVGMKGISSLEDLEKFYELVIAKHPEMIGFAETGLQYALSYTYSDKNLMWLDSRVVSDASANDDKLWSWYESPEFKAYSEIMRKWYEKGIIPKYAPTNPNQLMADWQAGKAMWKAGNALMPIENFQSMAKAVSTAKLTNYFLNKGDRPLISRGTYSTAYYVSANAKDPERYVMFFNLLQKNQELYDLFTYGVKDTDYKLDENGRVERLNSDPLFDDWMMMNVNFMRFNKDVADDFIESYRHWNDGSILRKDIGFVFDVEPVKTEAAKISAIETELLNPIGSGFISYEEQFPNALKKLKEAGIDKYMAEYQKQYSAWYAGKNKQ
ncbi:DUF3502 domain-containing protein [Paenibacillus sp. YIM B09110]|uniref:DUF3502 domain-containing protein n=1 Tax=Paenibacillus sp. YIM B09110 TaxID=3126102 RepID=UPI00301C99D5